MGDLYDGISFRIPFTTKQQEDNEVQDQAWLLPSHPPHPSPSQKESPLSTHPQH